MFFVNYQMIGQWTIGPNFFFFFLNYRAIGISIFAPNEETIEDIGFKKN